ncbi:MAG TPA: hypothetical protein VG737_09920 [Cyclobacteriaceae bacterium]|nr:hypothetical protein [Cyclobacteriaceae bacterium]
MKKTLNIALLLAFLTIAIPGNSFAPVDDPSKTEMSSAEAQRLLNRLEEIKAMDKTNMPRSQKRALRAEVKATQKKLKESSGGIYLSAGAVILIIVLLIIFL